MGISDKAIIEDNGLTYLMLMKSGENDTYLFEKIQVETGELSGDIILIKNHKDLDPKGKYLLGGAYLLAD
jgi:hypothetical protein